MKLVTLSLTVLIVLLQHPLWLGKGSWLRVWEVDQQMRPSVNESELACAMRRWMPR